MFRDRRPTFTHIRLFLTRARVVELSHGQQQRKRALYTMCDYTICVRTNGRRAMWCDVRVSNQSLSNDVFFLCHRGMAIHGLAAKNSENSFGDCKRLSYLPSRLIPTAMHFLSRQYWQRLRLTRWIIHCWFFVHGRYWIFCWMERRKKPCK